MRKRMLAFLLAIVLVMSVFAGCGSQEATETTTEAVTEEAAVEETAEAAEETAKEPAEPITATVGTWKTAQTLTPYYYQDLAPEGSTIEVEPFTNPGDQKTALLAGSLDMTGTTIPLAITAAANGEPIKIVVTLCNKCSALVVGKDSGIESPEDLKGKTIAYVPGTMHHVLLLNVLERAGLDPETDVTLTRIDFFDMGAALENGQIDAFLSGDSGRTEWLRRNPELSVLRRQHRHHQCRHDRYGRNDRNHPRTGSVSGQCPYRSSRIYECQPE